MHAEFVVECLRKGLYLCCTLWLQAEVQQQAIELQERDAEIRKLRRELTVRNYTVLIN